MSRPNDPDMCPVCETRNCHDRRHPPQPPPREVSETREEITPRS